MNLYDIDSPASAFISVPAWIEQDIDCTTIAAICQGGCASGAYMPAVTYWQASEIMAEHGDDVLEYIEQAACSLPPIPDDVSRKGIAVHFLSCAVELWAYTAEAVIECLVEGEGEG